MNKSFYCVLCKVQVAKFRKRKTLEKLLQILSKDDVNRRQSDAAATVIHVAKKSHAERSCIMTQIIRDSVTTRSDQEVF
jgi:hypothetical protein